MARTNEQPLKAVIEELLETYKLADKLKEVDIIQSWNKIMGNIIARHTTNLYISNKVLYVSLDSDALRQELSYAKKKIITMLTKEYKKPVITDIVFK
jgi:predicted nucleic acid-binding Zn ribbon protein